MRRPACNRLTLDDLAMPMALVPGLTALGDYSTFFRRIQRTSARLGVGRVERGP